MCRTTIWANTLAFVLIGLTYPFVPFFVSSCVPDLTWPELLVCPVSLPLRQFPAIILDSPALSDLVVQDWISWYRLITVLQVCVHNAPANQIFLSLLSCHQCHAISISCLLLPLLSTQICPGVSFLYLCFVQLFCPVPIVLPLSVTLSVPLYCLCPWPCPVSIPISVPCPASDCDPVYAPVREPVLPLSVTMSTPLSVSLSCLCDPVCPCPWACPAYVYDPVRDPARAPVIPLFSSLSCPVSYWPSYPTVLHFFPRPVCPQRYVTCPRKRLDIKKRLIGREFMFAYVLTLICVKFRT